MMPPRFCRILMIEDDEVRIARIAAWLPPDLRLVVTRSAGRAMRTLQLDRPTTYAGIMLDHDLQQQIAADAEASLSSSNLIDLIIRKIDHDVPVLVHSMNASRGPVLVERLRNAGFYTSYVPFEHLTRQGFLNWIEYVHELWEESL